MVYDRRQAAREFEKWSESYDRSILQWLLFRPSHRAIIRRIHQKHGDRPIKVLDVGCGTGVFGARIREALPNARVWGVDLVKEMLQGGAARWAAHDGDLTPVRGDSEALPFASGTFDVVTCANSFHHYPHQDRAVAEMRRVLEPGGTLMIIDGYRDAPYGWFIYDVCVAGVEGNVLHCSRKRMRSLFAEAGFSVDRQKVHRGFAPFLLTEGTALPTAAIPAPHLGRRAVAERGSYAA